MERKIIHEGVTFDDVLLIPEYSEVTPDQADLSARLTRNIRLVRPGSVAGVQLVIATGNAA